MWPLSALPNYKNPRFLGRLKTFPKVHEEALGTVREVERVMEELTSKVEELRTTLNAVYSQKMQELQEIKTNLTMQIPVALEEVERTLAEE